MPASNKNEAGLYQLDNGNWKYRIKMKINGKVKDVSSIQDELGKPYTTKKAARAAREEKLAELKAPPIEKIYKDRTIGEIYAIYCSSSGAQSKAKSTLRKQNSLWDNHVKQVFEDKKISEITLSDLQDYLQQLYDKGDEYNGFKEGYAYGYVLGFLRFFYLLFGEAYRRDSIDHIRYQKMFTVKDTRLSMPNKRQIDVENDKIVKVYDAGELKRINNVLKNGNGYTAFLLGYYLGVRISECFGLMWDDIDWDAGTIVVKRQMIFQDNIFCLCPVKTIASSRVVDMGPDLQNYLHDFWLKQEENKRKMGDGWKAWETVIDRVNPKDVHKLVGGNFINRTTKGELCTINSFKFWTKKVKALEKIDFQYHTLRKTHATMMANLNTPALELMKRLGHKKYETTMKYYLDENSLAKVLLKANLQKLDFNPMTDGFNSLTDFAEKGIVPTHEEMEEMGAFYDKHGTGPKPKKFPKRADGTTGVSDEIRNAPLSIDDI